MRLFVRLMALLLVVALAGPFFLRGPDGAPLATWGDVRNWLGNAGRDVRFGLERMQRKAGRLVSDNSVGETPVYRWQDAEGGWHFSGQTPEGIASELIYVDGDANVYAAPEERAPANTPGKSDTLAAPTEIPLPSPLSVPPGSVPELINDAYESRKALEERPLPD